MRGLRWAALALREFEEGTTYIAQEDPARAERVARRIFDAIQKLREYPYIGHVSEDPMLRQWHVAQTPYIVVYRVHTDAIEVARVFHTSRQPWGRKPAGP